MPGRNMGETAVLDWFADRERRGLPPIFPLASKPQGQQVKMAFHYVGAPDHLARAADRLGMGAKALDEARRNHSMSRFGALVAQLVSCPLNAEQGIIEEAEVSRNAIAIALEAMDEILIKAHLAFDPMILTIPEEPPSVDVAPIKLKRPRKGE